MLCLQGQGLLQFSLIRHCQLPAAFGAAACQYFTAIRCLHTLTKAMYAFTAAAMGLKCTFHCYILFSRLSRFWQDFEIRPGTKDSFGGEAVLVSIRNRSPHPLFCERTAKVRDRDQNREIKSQKI
jgi:hypothetical protein